MSTNRSTTTRIIHRRSDTGRITTPDFARRHPSTTEREVVRVPVKPQQPKK